eukprot:554773-Amphidinium_carterae.1
MTTRTISPDRRNTLPVDQGGFKVPDGRYPGRRQKPVQLDTRWHRLSVIRHLDFSTFLVPVRASKDDVREVFRLLLTPHTKRSHMERTI